VKNNLHSEPGVCMVLGMDAANIETVKAAVSRMTIAVVTAFAQLWAPGSWATDGLTFPSRLERAIRRASASK
ncbi:hypothetical protein, partial [Mesorhizobium sp. WSM4989]|uniref:hypothetical protein n=1 Tax=Mesorhizobium sp. WSM4989 TaxID=3038541 RepID=UPI00241671A7